MKKEKENVEGDRVIVGLKEYLGEQLKTGEEQKVEIQKENLKEEETEIEINMLLKFIIKGTKVGKRPGIDNMRPEMIMHIGEKGHQKQHGKPKTEWKTNKIPTEWN